MLLNFGNVVPHAPRHQPLLPLSHKPRTLFLTRSSIDTLRSMPRCCRRTFMTTSLNANAESPLQRGYKARPFACETCNQVGLSLSGGIRRAAGTDRLMFMVDFWGKKSHTDK